MHNFLETVAFMEWMNKDHFLIFVFIFYSQLHCDGSWWAFTKYGQNDIVSTIGKYTTNAVHVMPEAQSEILLSCYDILILFLKLFNEYYKSLWKCGKNKYINICVPDSKTKMFKKIPFLEIIFNGIS